MTKKEKPIFRVLLIHSTMMVSGLEVCELAVLAEMLADRFVVNDTIQVGKDCCLLILRKG